MEPRVSLKESTKCFFEIGEVSRVAQWTLLKSHILGYDRLFPEFLPPCSRHQSGKQQHLLFFYLFFFLNNVFISPSGSLRQALSQILLDLNWVLINTLTDSMPPYDIPGNEIQTH